MITKRFYLVLAILLATIALVAVLLLKGPSRAKIEDGSIAVERDVDVVLVRDEKVYNANNYASASFFVSEGEKVSQGTSIAQVYKWGFNEKLLTDLIDVQQKIQNKQENEIWADTVNADLNDYNSKISNTISEIAQVIQGKSDADLVTLERKLKELSEQKQTFLRKNVQANDELNALYAQEQQYLERLANWREEITAEDAGVISFYLDGLETQLTPYNLDTLTRKDIENAKKGVVTNTTSADSATKPLYRVINNFKWYCLIMVDIDKAIDELVEGGEVKMTFEGYYDRPYTAKVASIRVPEDGGKLYVLEMSEDVTPLLSVRTADAHLQVEYTGCKVPEKALFTQDNKQYVKLVQGNTATLVPVEVSIKTKDAAIVTSQDPQITLKAGMELQLR